MDENIFDQIKEVDLKKTMEKSYIDYSMSVIACRALPDIRDGLKPVQRRILYSMIELNNGPDKPHKKCARIVGETMGKYHPHGDGSIYGALVNMAQDWSMRETLVEGHGNFGSEDGDGAAAMRYTEARLSKIAMEMLADINKDTVDFVPNYDETEKEPVVLPARFPNLLVNGSTGIAVGMATNIPPHNLGEVINGVVKIIDNKVEEDRDTTVEELMEIIKGPDFPTGAEILGRQGIESAYRTGRGKIPVRAVTTIEEMGNGKSRIVATELPYAVNKARLIERIAELTKEKKIDGITDLRDESDRDGIRVVIELRRDVNANVVLNQLYKHTDMQTTFGVIMLALVNNEPKILSLPEVLGHYLVHQQSVVTRRIRYDLNKAEERAHILEGLLIALDNIDEVIQIVRSSASTAEAKSRLCERFNLSDVQAQAIVDMRIRTLTGLERERLENEYKELQAKIAEWKEILADEKKLLGVIRSELLAISEKYGDERRTKIGRAVGEMMDEDLIENEPTIVAMTKLGYIKRMSEDNFRAQRRGGKGIKGMQTLEEDYIKTLLMTTTHQPMMLFTNKGRVYNLKAYEIPEAGRTARGTALVNLLNLGVGEKITAVIPAIPLDEEHFVFFSTRKGMVKKTPLMDFANIRRKGIQAIVLQEEDELAGVTFTDGNRKVVLVTEQGMSICFMEADVRSTGRGSMGVMGIRLEDNDNVIGMQLDSEGEEILFVSENGMGKRSDIQSFPVQGRAGKGVKCYKITGKTGKLAACRPVCDGLQVLMITTNGTMIRMEVSDIPVLGRITSGVKLMNIDPESGNLVASITEARIEDAGEEIAGLPEGEAEEETAEDDTPDENE